MICGIPSLKQGFNVQEERGRFSETIASVVTLDSVAHLWLAGFSLMSSCCIYDQHSHTANQGCYPQSNSVPPSPTLYANTTSFNPAMPAS